MKRKGVVVFIVLILTFTVLLNIGLNQIEMKAEASNGYPVHNLDTGLDYTSIQEAIDANETLDGHTIFVEEGTYFEHVTVDKSLILLGEDRETTIIDGNMTGNVVRITQDYVKIKGFTIQRSGRVSFNSGITIGSTQHCDISANRIVDNEIGIYGIPSNTSITDNNLGENYIGVAIDPGATGNVISRNYLVGNTVSVHLHYADSNHVFQNTMTSNWRSATLWYSKNNRFYHNNFLNNTEKIRIFPYTNFLDNGFEGNYWSNFTGVDSDYDGISDISHVIDANNQDNYPLMGMSSSFSTSLDTYLNVISNSTIDSFNYFDSNSTIKMHVSNMTNNQTDGFVRICIPHALMIEPYNITVNRVNPTYWNYNLHDNGSHKWIYFAYEHSTLEILIVPEFPSLMLLPLLMTIALLGAVVSKRKIR